MARLAKKKIGVKKGVQKTRRKPSARRPRGVLRKKQPPFEKFEGNPIITPREGNEWESKATFNPSALHVEGNVHILYRAIGDGDVSVLGYAVSRDGFSVDERGEQPAFAPHKIKIFSPEERMQAPLIYSSGGGWNGGCEDPRLTLIDGRVYLIYTAFDGWASLRRALTSISLEDFLEKRWKWEKPVLISPPGEIHKNWVLFPEKINGKYAILHSISPTVRIDYFDSLDIFDGTKFIQSVPGNRQEEIGWGVMKGAGPPPIKTEDGWLLFYHGLDKLDPGRYKLGAMLLDLKDPTKVLYRSPRPILEPDEYYENHGFKGGIIYSCGAVVIGNDLLIYYGGADAVVCVATAKLDQFLKELKTHEIPKLKAVKKRSRNARN